MTKEIICRGGEVALCDDEDYDFLIRFPWYYGGQRHKSYVVASGGRHAKTQLTYFMHTMLLGGRMVDHINGNTLDNRKENLRICTYQQNGWNKGKGKACRNGKNTSQYKGVSYRPIRGKDRWAVLIKHVEPGAHKNTGRMIRVGYFFSEIEAAKAYNKKIVELRGEWAWLNPIPED